MAVAHSLYREAGSVTINAATCKQCGLCARICPTEVLRFESGNIRIHADSHLGCIACGHCMMVCPDVSVTVTGRGISPDDLRPLPQSDEVATAKTLGALMSMRRSVRRFKDEDLDPKLLQQVVDMASTGPMGIPPWDVGCVVVAGRIRVKMLSDHIITGYEGILKVFKPWMLFVMRPFMKRSMLDQFRTFILPLAKSYVHGRKEGKDLLFYGAPAVLIFYHSAYADVPDATIACTYAMLAAESLGLGSTMIGAAAPILQRNKKLCVHLGIPDGNKPAIALIVGQPAVHFRKTIHRNFSHVHFMSAVTS